MDTKHSLLQWVEAAGVELRRDGTAWTGACPFHEDTGRSLLVDPEKNHWQCDGECQIGGSLVDWVARIKHVSMTHAQELLCSEAPLSAMRPVEGGGATTVRSLTAPFALGDDDQTVLQQVIGYYHETLKQSPAALAYLRERRLDHPDCIAHFKLGFSNRTLGYRLPAKNRKAGAAMRGRLQRIGILRSNGHEHFRGSLVIPTVNQGRIEHVYGRKIAGKLRPGTSLHCQLPHPPTGLFNLEAIKTSDELIVCQSLIDALTFWCAGYRNVTGGYGFNAIDETHVSTYVQYGVKRVSIAFTATPEADTEARQLAEHLVARGIDAYRIEFPRGLDANAFAVQAKPPHKHLGRLIRQAAWLGKGNAPLRETGTGLDVDTEGG
ncbi:MAG: CHC2 zinc finger domain-containing protein [Gammaproteobacteria bacterium]|nr:CHC2 zinc finger domain-containing protein [Gammaproteobacteria bacterium]